MCKFCYFSLALLSLLIAVLAYRFIVVGQVEATEDGRIALQLSADERNMVLTEMRDFLIAVQNILDGSNQDNLPQIIQAARRVGMAAQTSIPAGLISKLPLEFKTLGFDTHTRFDQLALDAEQFGDVQQVREQLAELMQNCIACHATYRIGLEGEK